MEAYQQFFRPSTGLVGGAYTAARTMPVASAAHQNSCLSDDHQEKETLALPRYIILLQNAEPMPRCTKITAKRPLITRTLMRTRLTT